MNPSLVIETIKPTCSYVVKCMPSWTGYNHCFDCPVNTANAGNADYTFFSLGVLFWLTVTLFIILYE